MNSIIPYLTLFIVGIQTFILFAVILVVILMLISYIMLIFLKVPYVPSRKSVIQLLFQNFSFQKNTTFIDIGSGGGPVLFQAEKHSLKAIGYEISPLPYLISIVDKFIYRSKVQIYFRDFRRANFSHANYIYCYLFPETIEEIWPKIKKECQPGTYFICNTFKLKSLKPVQIIADSKQNPKIYIYQT